MSGVTFIFFQNRLLTHEKFNPLVKFVHCRPEGNPCFSHHMKLTRLAYKGFRKLYDHLPFKKSVCLLLRTLPIRDRIYKDFRFHGTFSVRLGSGQMKLGHWGGSIENEIFWKGLYGWEGESIKLWMQEVQKADVIFDVGANTGVYALIARHLNPKAKIYAFEPVDYTYQRMLENFARNKADITPTTYALSHETGTSTFYETVDENQTSSSLSPDKSKNWDLYQGELIEKQISTIRLDDFMAKEGLTGLSLLKIDVEMHEPQVLMGMGTWLKETRPNMLIEILSPNVAAQVSELIEGLGYRIYHVHDEHGPKEVNAITVVPGHWNYFLTTKAL